MVGEKAVKKLKTNSRRFKEIREQMHATPAVGMGVLPHLHINERIGCIVPTTQNNGVIVYSKNIALSGEDNLIVMPDYNLIQPHLVSVY